MLGGPDSRRRLSGALALWRSPIGKKAVMALTGVVLFGFVVGHLLGNLQVFLGREKLDAYAAFLHGSPGLLWGTRAVLVGCTALHVLAAVQLTLLSRAARPVAYHLHEPVQATYAARTMVWSGLIIAAFVVYHLLHLTTGTVHPDYREMAVYDNLVKGFRSVPASATYLVAMVLLGLHLQHGLWSLFQTLGVSHPRALPLLRRSAALVAAAIVAGNVSIPIAVLAGLVR